MKTSKKLLFLFRSLALIAGISWIVAYSCFQIWGFPMFYTWLLTTIIQVWGNNVYDYVYDKYISDFKINEQLQHYAELPYKEYPVELICEHCRNKQTVFLDLQNSQFECNACERLNGIHTTIKVAAITDIPETIKI